MSQSQVLSQSETIKLLLDRSQRDNRRVPLAESFVQLRTKSGKARAGPLADLVRDPRGLQLFLLAHAVASGGDYSVTEWSTTWARTLGLFDGTSGPTAVSRTWRRLEQLQLVDRTRGRGGHAKITLLREDGSGRKYSHPNDRKEPYFGLPFEYWESSEQWHVTLSMPAKVMLLVALNDRKPEFTLPLDKLDEWYGLSADFAGDGLAELRRAGLLDLVREEFFPTLKSRTGYAARNVYRLLPPFDLASRGMGVRPATSRRKVSTKTAKVRCRSG